MIAQIRRVEEAAIRSPVHLIVPNATSGLSTHLLRKRPSTSWRDYSPDDDEATLGKLRLVCVILLTAEGFPVVLLKRAKDGMALQGALHLPDLDRLAHSRTWRLGVVTARIDMHWIIGRARVARNGLCATSAFLLDVSVQFLASCLAEGLAEAQNTRSEQHQDEMLQRKRSHRNEFHRN